MEYYAGIDVSLESSSVCVMDATGRIVREGKVASEPEALVRFLADLGLAIVRIGLEAGPLSQWLHAGMTAAGLEVVLVETRHVKAALSGHAARHSTSSTSLGCFRAPHSGSGGARPFRMQAGF